MLRPDHIWFFFTVTLSLALAMSIPPRKPEPQNQANLYTQVGEPPALKLIGGEANHRAAVLGPRNLIAG